MARLSNDEKVAKKKADIEIEKRKLKQLQALANQDNRKRENKEKYDIGGLVKKADSSLMQVDKGVLLGAFIEIAEVVKTNPDKIRDWKQVGDNKFLIDESNRQRSGNQKEGDDLNHGNENN